MNKKALGLIFTLVASLFVPILFIVSSHAHTVNTMSEGSYPAVYGNIIAFQRSSDSHLVYYDIVTTVVTDTGVIGAFPSVYGSIIAFLGQGIGGGVEILYYDISTGILRRTGATGDIYMLVDYAADAATPSVYGNIIAFHVIPSGGGNRTIYYYNISAGALINTEIVGRWASVYGDIISFYTNEGWVEEDLNHDGDQVDDVIRYYEISTAAVTNTGVVGKSPWTYRDIIVFSTSEAQEGEDLNFDGDQLDYVIRYFCIPGSLLVNKARDGNRPSLWGGIIVFETGESLVTPPRDFNLDGDTDDWVIRFYNALTGEQVIPAAPRPALTGGGGRVYGSFLPFTQESIVALHTRENWMGVDWNNDGDQDDTFIRYVRVPIPGDINGDGYVDLADAILLCGVYGSYGDPTWDPRADLDGDGNITVADSVIWTINYGSLGPDGDVNSDGIVDMFDGYIIQSVMHSQGSPNFNPYADLNDDGRVGIKDAVILSINYGTWLEDP